MRQLRLPIPKTAIALVLSFLLLGQIAAGQIVADSTPAAASEPAEWSASYQQRIRPILAEVCFNCHNSKIQEGDIRLDQLNVEIGSQTFDATVWHDVLDQIKRGEMPPDRTFKASDPSIETSPDASEESPRRLTVQQRRELVSWIGSILEAAESSKRFADGRVLMRRLTRYEYANTLRDLLGIDLDFSRDLPPEPASPDGFLNDGATLEMSPTQIETYLSAARRALQIAIVDGDKPEVYRYHATETAVGKLPRKREGGHLPVNPEFVLDIPSFPRRGEFRLLVRAAAVRPPGHAMPRLRVSLGNVPGIIHVPRKLVGEVDVTATAKLPQTFAFHGRIEDYPQPGDREFGANVDFDGMIALFDFLDADGEELRYQDRTYSDPPAPKKAKGKTPAPRAREVPSQGPRLDLVIESVEFEVPYLRSWPPPSHQRLMRCSANAKTDKQKAKEILERFMPLAFRRPLIEGELNDTLKLFGKIRPMVESFPEAIRETLASVLVSPNFLYILDERVEEDHPDGRTRLSEFELATRLSYFLWSTMPDRTLRELAASGELSRPDNLKAQVQRMLDDVKAGQLVEHFADQWFGLSNLDRVAVNPEYYPDFDNELKHAMREETRGVLSEILRQDRSCLELIDSDWTVVNRALAKHYGLKNPPTSSQFEQVLMTENDRRGGILHHGSFLLSQSDGERPHPIRRAVWILDRLLDSPPASPPPDVPELDENATGNETQTLKQQLEIHRSKESCRSCHEGIDPWGIPLEHFDAVGVWRERSPVPVAAKKKGGGNSSNPDAPLVDASTMLPKGHSITGADELARYLASQRHELFADAIVKRLASYALGRSLDVGDRRAIDELTADLKNQDFRLRQLVHDLVQSDLFQTK